MVWGSDAEEQVRPPQRQTARIAEDGQPGVHGQPDHHDVADRAEAGRLAQRYPGQQHDRPHDHGDRAEPQPGVPGEPLVQDVDESKVPRGLGSGIYNAAGDLGSFLGPTIGGVIAQATSIGSVFIIGPLGTTALFLLGILAARRLRSPATAVVNPS